MDIVLSWFVCIHIRNYGGLILKRLDNLAISFRPLIQHGTYNEEAFNNGSFSIFLLYSHPECLSTKTTLSPLRNILDIYLSLVIVFPFFP